MNQKNSTPTSYNTTAKLFHWLTAIIVIGLIAIGFYMQEMPKGTNKFALYGWHKSFGITILGLTALRLSWRLYEPPPALPTSLQSHEKYGAHIAHSILYLCLFIMPLSGWLMSSAVGFPVSFFNLVQLPDLIEPNRQLHNLFKDIHSCAAWILITTIILHVSAALMHHFYRKDTILERMLP